MIDARRAAVLLAAWLLVASALAPALGSARPAHEIPVEQVDGTLSGVDSTGWDRVPAASVPLESAPSAVPNANETTTERVDVQAAHNDSHLFVRVQWPDATQDADAADPREFTDAFAVQVPANTTKRPPIAMGGAGNMVNVWYWNADTSAEELLAGGAGTTTKFQDQSVSVSATHTGEGANGTWTAVFTRELDPGGENRTTVPEDDDLDVAFAAWNGSSGERSGQKAVSEWYYLATGPGPQGPPYAAILWAISGISIVATIAVTVRGVRRTGEGGN